MATKNLGITKLISDGIFSAAYPLHEVKQKNYLFKENYFIGKIYYDYSY